VFQCVAVCCSVLQCVVMYCCEHPGVLLHILAFLYMCMCVYMCACAYMFMVHKGLLMKASPKASPDDISFIFAT